MSAKIALAAVDIFCVVSRLQSQPPPPARAPGEPQLASLPATANSPATGVPQVQPSQTASAEATVAKIVAPPNPGSADPSGSVRSKRQAGIPPVCCTKDPCDPCATTPCIACPLCG